MSIGMMNSEQCQTAGCSIDASNICKRERTIICHTCAAILHSNCHLSIKDEGGFIMNAVELLKDILKKINPEELVCTNNSNTNYYIKIAYNYDSFYFLWNNRNYEENKKEYALN